MADKIPLSASLEDYLEAIYNIIQEKRAVRAKDVAARLKVSNASVTGALKALSKRNLLNYAPYDVITLTPEGESVAREVVRKHKILKEFLETVLNIDPVEADKAACQLEHGIQSEVVERLIKFIEFIDICPLGGRKLIEGFKRHLECSSMEEGCERCVQLAKEALHDRKDVGEEPARIVLADLLPGQKGVLRRIRATKEVKKRLLGMGLVPGAVVKVERVAPAGDPIEVTVRGYNLSLRQDEARKLEVEPR